MRVGNWEPHFFRLIDPNLVDSRLVDRRTFKHVSLTSRSTEDFGSLVTRSILNCSGNNRMI